MSFRVLVVDDDETVVEAVTTLLTISGYEVQSVMRAEDAQVRLEQSRPDLLILDIHMPGMNGIELLTQIRAAEEQAADRPKLPVIILTGCAGEDVPVKAIKLKSDDYIHKPFEATQFIHSVERCIRIAALEREKLEYNRMLEEKISERTRDLQQAQTQLIELNHGLERMVESRTAELRTAHERLVLSEKMAVIGKLASSVAHELRNPLASIKNVGYYLSKQIKSDDKKVEGLLNILNEETDRSNRIISELLDFSRVRKIVKKQVNINELIERSLAEVCIYGKVSVTKSLSRDLAPFQADADALMRSFFHICSNACEAMHYEGTLSVAAIRDREYRPGIPYARISFSDTGCGMDTATVSQVFEPLFTTKPKGIGLGLSVVKDVVTSHGGTIQISSEIGKGTTITILLPLEGERNG